MRNLTTQEFRALELIDIYISCMSEPNIDTKTIYEFVGMVYQLGYDCGYTPGYFLTPNDAAVISLNEIKWRIAFSLTKNKALPLLLLEDPGLFDNLFI